MSTTLDHHYQDHHEGLIDIGTSVRQASPIYLDERATAETPDSATLEKNFIDAKAFILAATTKDGANL